MSKKRIVITGANGFIACKIAEKLHNKDYLLYGTSQSSLSNPFIENKHFLSVDLVHNYQKLEDWLYEIQPDHIVHTAAFTAVDGCEENKEDCVELNVEVTQRLGEYCSKTNTPILHLSTDFVFEGKKGKVYTEDSAVHPQNMYGQSKALSEVALISSSCMFSILRVVLVHGYAEGSKKSNFLLWVKNSLEQKKEIKVVEDHYRKPTWIDDIATAAETLIENPKKGIFHITGQDLLSVYEFAQKIADFWSLDKKLILPIRAEDIGQDKNRPQSTDLANDLTVRELEISPTPMQLSFEKIDEQLKNKVSR